MKILIIDDEEDFRTITASCLGLLGGAEVVEANCGSVGIRRAEQEQPDVILLDLMMPEMNGIDTLKNMRKNPSIQDIPVIFLTTNGMFEEFAELKELGALAVLTKPFDPITIGDQIREILQQSKVKKD